MTRKFVIADPALRLTGGHHYTLAVALSEAAQALGYEVLWLCGHDLPARLPPRGVRVERVFPVSNYWIKARGPRLWRIRLYNALMDRIASPTAHRIGWRWLRLFPFEQELADALARCDVGPDDHLLITSAEYLQYQGLLHLLESVPPERLPFIHVRTSYDENMVHNAKFGPRLPALFRRFAELGRVGRRLFFYAEIPELAADFNRWGLVPFETLPTPAPVRPASQTPPRAASQDRPLTILFPGQPRLEKGYGRLPAIVAALLERRDVARPFRFVFQSTPKRSGRTAPSVAVVRERLRQFPADRVRLLEDALNNEAYYRLLAAADIVLLPYDALRYRNRPSMIAVEAALFGKPLVVTAGVPVAALARDGCGAVAASDGEFASRLAQVVNDYDAYHARALARAARLKREHDARTLVRRMVVRAEAGRGHGPSVETEMPPMCAASNG